MTTAPSDSSTASSLRQRAAKANTNPDGTKTSEKAKEISSAALDRASSSLSILDILRAVAGLALVSTLASFAVTSGESFTWGLLDPSARPWFLDPQRLGDVVLEKIRGPPAMIELTNDELAAYDGSDEGKPIYLALNRTIYDVSASPKVYGPGGMYSTLAAKDASRSYITTCFDPVEDLVPYFGGVEEVYVPLWLSKKPWKGEMDAISKNSPMFGGQDAEDLIDGLRKKVGRKNVKKLQNEAYETAKGRVREQVQNWERMFANKNYRVVGRVVGVDEVDPNKWKHLGFCEAAQKLRPNMADSLTHAMESVGKGDKLNINMGAMAGKMAGAKGKPAKKSKKAKDKDSTDHGMMGDTDHGNSEHANANIEDMLPGGKFHDKAKKTDKKDKKRPGIVEEKVRQKLEHGDEEKAKENIEQLKANKGGRQPEIPNAVPDAVLDDEQRDDL